MKNNRVLILGGSHSELPLIRAARDIGLMVFTSGNQPDHPGHALADHYLPGDFSDADQMIEVAKLSKCDFIVSAANDYAYLSACKVAESLDFAGFDSLDIAETLHHKHHFKRTAVALGLPVTRSITLEPEASELPNSSGLHYPLVVKPVDLTGGKGITVVQNPADISAAISYARQISKQGVLVVEEYFDGSLHSYSTIIKDGKVIFEYADDEYCDANPYLVSTSTSIARVPLNVLTDLRYQTEKLANYLDLVDGILHCQFLYGDGDYVILEYTRRCSGDLYSDVVQAVTGVKHAEQFIRSSMMLEFDLTRMHPTGDYIARYCVYAHSPGRFNGIEISTIIQPWVNSITAAVPEGKMLGTSKTEKAAVVILNFPNYRDMLELRSELNSHLKCKIS